ncbi:MAG: IgGFc-binding protein [Myxococcales bacterium]|nr:IgGFc-binding protein [Myxococcales bacterium]
MKCARILLTVAISCWIGTMGPGCGSNGDGTTTGGGDTSSDVSRIDDTALSDNATSDDFIPSDSCADDSCLPIVDGFECQPDQSRCSPSGELEVCVQGSFVLSKCPNGTTCLVGECKMPLCTAGTMRCANFLEEEVCSNDGTTYQKQTCPADSACLVDHCVPGCVPETTRCEDNVVYRCNASGKEEKERECNTADGEVCAAGTCYTACEWQDSKRGNYGCRFIAAQLPNDETADDNIFAFVFSNPDPTRTVKVTVNDPTGKTSVISIGPESLAKHELVPPRSFIVRGSGISHSGFLITSSHPIVAFMFNPLEKYDKDSMNTVATNDGSLLLPSAVLGTEYIAVTWSDPGQYSQPPYVTVVAVEDETEVEVTPSQTILVPMEPYLLAAKKTYTFKLSAQDVLNLEAKGLDLTGTRIASNRPVAVFSGNACARVPNSGRFCDHVEAQLPSIETWGKEYWVTKFTDRGGDNDYFRIVARDDNTVLTFDPPRENVPTLAKGAYFEIASTSSFKLTSSKPIMVAQFMASMSVTSPTGPFGKDEPPYTDNYCPDEDVGGGTCWGDPALVLVPAKEQLRSQYLFLVPDTYRYDFVNIGFAPGTTIELNGTTLDLSKAESVGAGDFLQLTLVMESGVQKIVASAPISVIVYGFDHNISYAYNAGLNFTVLP